MRSRKRLSRQSCGTSLALVTAALIATPLAADTDVEAILKCQSMQDDAARLSCYDSLNAPPSDSPAPPAAAEEQVPARPAEPAIPTTPTAEAISEKPAAPAPAAEAMPANEPEVLDDDVGRERLGPRPGEELLVRGKVIKCRKDISSKYRFYFENGQIWQQKDNTKVRWEDCNFEVTISKDFFGYRMVRDGDKKKVRISRLK